MATQTTNYGLSLPEDTDTADIAVLNGNFQKLDDAALKAQAAKAAPVDGDSVALVDSVDGGKTKRVLWSSIKTALGNVFAALNHTHAWGAITGRPSSFTPAAHAATHASGESDPITPAAIGAAVVSHTHTWGAITGRPSSFTPAAHAATHASRGSDPITPTAIGAAGLVDVNAGWKLLQSYTTAGAFTWTAPDLFNGQNYKIGVLIIGGGGGGACAALTVACNASGGGSGHAKNIVFVVSHGQEYSGVVGAGGLGITNSLGTITDGNSGGSSAFNGISVNGGAGGRSKNNTSFAAGADGGQQSTDYANMTTSAFGGAVISLTSCPLECLNPFENKQILGAGGYGYGAGPYYSGPGGKDPITGLGGGNGSGTYRISANAENATSPGCGGGGAGCCGTTGNTATCGSGADGAVYIYVQGVNS